MLQAGNNALKKIGDIEINYLNIELICRHVYNFVPIDNTQCCLVNSSDLHHTFAIEISDDVRAIK
jgi:hypothetical protein